MGKQTTVDMAGAPINGAKEWNSIAWKAAWKQVRRLQMRIAKAVQEERWNKVKALQYLLTRSLAAKLLAVKRVTLEQVGSGVRSYLFFHDFLHVTAGWHLPFNPPRLLSFVGGNKLVK